MAGRHQRTGAQEGRTLLGRRPPGRLLGVGRGRRRVLMRRGGRGRGRRGGRRGLGEVAQQLVEAGRVGQQVEVVGDDGRGGGRRSRGGCRPAVAVGRAAPRAGGRRGAAAAERVDDNVEAGDVAVVRGRRRDLLLGRGTDERLEDVDHVRVVQDGRLAGRGLALGRQEDHQGGLGLAVQVLLLLLLLAVVRLLLLGLRGLLTVVGRRGKPGLDRLYLSLDDVLEILSDWKLYNFVTIIIYYYL